MYDIKSDIESWVDVKLKPIGPPTQPEMQEQRIRKELDEVLEAIQLGHTDEEVVMEYADVVISCFTAVKLAYPHLDLMTFIRRKMNINWDRNWEIGPDGLGRHVKNREVEDNALHGLAIERGDSSGDF